MTARSEPSAFAGVFRPADWPQMADYGLVCLVQAARVAAPTMISVTDASPMWRPHIGIIRSQTTTVP